MISIIIPTRNEESVLEKTLTHFKKTLTLPHEIIISDGNSTDKTLEIARKYADKVIEADPTKRQNIAIGRNTGAAAAQGDFLVFLDADCTILDPNTFFTQALKHFEAGQENQNQQKQGRKKTVALIPAIRVLPGCETFADKVIWSYINIQYNIMNNLFNVGIAGGEFQMMRTLDFRTVGGYNPDLAASEDVDMMRRLSKRGQIRFDLGMTVYHTGRRAHKTGWTKLLYICVVNTFSLWIFGKSKSTEWTVVR